VGSQRLPIPLLSGAAQRLSFLHSKSAVGVSLKKSRLHTFFAAILSKSDTRIIFFDEIFAGVTRCLLWVENLQTRGRL